MLNKTRPVSLALAGMLLAIASGLCVSGGAFAQAYPSKPIRAIVAFAPGGIADGIGRLIGQKLTERMGQSVVVENRDGAAGTLAARAVAAASPDGYTLLVHTAAVAISPSVSKEGFDPLTELVPVAMVANSSVTTTTAGNPSDATVTVSWTLHDVHDPQLPSPMTAQSTSRLHAARSVRICSPAPLTRASTTKRWIAAPSRRNNDSQASSTIS